MKIFGGIFIVLSAATVTADAQVKPLSSSVYQYPDMSSASEQTLVKGATTYFKSYEVDVVNVTKSNNTLHGNTSSDTEALLIVRQGTLKVTIGSTSKVLGPGSIAFIMPGETYKIQLDGGRESVFYKLVAISKTPDVRERGKANGGSLLINVDSIMFKATERGGRRDYFDRATAICDDFEMHVTTLNEGLPSHAPHTHAQEEIILLMKGNATMAINNKDYEISPGSVVFLAAGDLHGIRNTGKGQCEYFAFQWK